jgi:C1A family cysteine protease
MSNKTNIFACVLLLAIVSSTLASPHLDLVELKSVWTSWKNVHNKEYNFIKEESARFAIFVENYKKIIDHNSKNEDVKLGLNRFGDLTVEEFKSLHSGCYQSNTERVQNQQAQQFRQKLNPYHQIDYRVLNLPDSVDWRQKGAVTDVKNQEQCGSCWAFSTTGALESLHYINSGQLLSFSEQQIVDCDKTDGGCEGGLPAQAFEYTANAGVETEQDYPYQAADGKCQYDQSKAIIVNSGQKSVKAQDVNALKAALVVQPVSIGIEADQNTFQFYKSGVLKSGCGDNLDHAVLAVGYTTINGDEAFIVKNSWGSDWGVGGYVYISTDAKANGGNGVCGILGDPVIPTA